MALQRRLPIGAEVQPAGGAHFRVWAPRRRQVAVVLESRPELPGLRAEAVPLELDEHGYFSGYLAQAVPGTRYRFRLDDDPLLYPDPASRFQPEGVHGPSEVVDPSVYVWNDAGWHGVDLEGQVIYEMHIGTFTAEGTFTAA